MPSRKVPQSITELVAAAWSHSFESLAKCPTGSKIQENDQLIPGWHRQGRKSAEPREPEADPVTTAQRILSMLLARAKSNPDQKWMQVDLEVIRNVDRQSLLKELWVLGCECEEYEDSWYISLMGRTRGKNAIEKYLTASELLVSA